MHSLDPNKREQRSGPPSYSSPAYQDDDVIAFYEKLGFSRHPYEELPQAVKDYFERVGDFPTAQDHEHLFLKAR